MTSSGPNRTAGPARSRAARSASASVSMKLPDGHRSGLAGEIARLWGDA